MCVYVRWILTKKTFKFRQNIKIVCVSSQTPPTWFISIKYDLIWFNCTLNFSFHIAKNTVTSEFEKQYKKHANARSNLLKARETYDKSLAHHIEIEEKYNDFNKEFLELSKVVSYVSSFFVFRVQDLFYWFWWLVWFMCHGCWIRPCLHSYRCFHFFCFTLYSARPTSQNVWILSDTY